MKTFLLAMLGAAFPLPGYEIKWASTPDVATNVPFSIDFEMKFPHRITTNRTHPLIIFNPGPPRPDQIEIAVSLIGKSERRVGFEVIFAKNSKFEANQYFLPSYILNETTVFQFKASLRNTDSLASLVGPQVVSYSPKFTIKKTPQEQWVMPDQRFLELGDSNRETVSLIRRDGKLFAQFFENGVIATRFLE
jgi:hypothetical protein